MQKEKKKKDEFASCICWLAKAERTVNDGLLLIGLIKTRSVIVVSKQQDERCRNEGTCLKARVESYTAIEFVLLCGL
jgi:hypothetical protein